MSELKPCRLELWDAINDYCESCGGSPGEHVYGNVRRQNAAYAIESAVRRVQMDFIPARMVSLLHTQAELCEHLDLMVRYLREETSEGDGIRDYHYDGYMAAKALVERLGKNEQEREDAIVSFYEMQKQIVKLARLEKWLAEQEERVRKLVEQGVNMHTTGAVLSEVRKAMKGSE